MASKRKMGEMIQSETTNMKKVGDIIQAFVVQRSNQAFVVPNSSQALVVRNRLQVSEVQNDTQVIAALSEVLEFTIRKEVLGEAQNGVQYEKILMSN